MPSKNKILYTEKKMRYKKSITDLLKELSITSFIKVVSSFYYHKLMKKKWFMFNKKEYSYYFKRRDGSWESERTVELPLIWDILQKNKGKRILEIGNVLAYFYDINHDVLDKYEVIGSVINEDVIYFKPKKKYDLIISISTLEHVGFNEKQKDKTKVLKAINNLKRILNKRGKIIITIPLNFNKNLDKYIKEGMIKFDEEYYLKRISKYNEWIETNKNDAFKSKYDSPYKYANALFIGVIRK